MTRRRPWLSALALCCLTGLGMAADEVLPQPQRVLICAHSFMTFIAKMLPAMAESGGVGFALAGHQMIGGSQVIQHWDLPKGKARPVLQAGLADTLILSPFLQLPDPGIDNFTRLGISANPRLRVLIQASWPAYDDSGSATIAEFTLRAARFSNAQRDLATLEDLERMRTAQRQGWSARLGEQVAALNREIGHEAVSIVPVNEAVFALRARVLAGTVPGLSRQSDLFADPIGHPTPPLTALVTYCHYAAIYQRSPVGLPVPPALKRIGPATELNAVLQQIAWEAVGPRSP